MRIARADAVTVLWSPLQRPENHHVERALEQLDAVLVACALRHKVGVNLPPR